MNIREEAACLAAKLTLEEKIGMVHGSQLFQTKGVERLGIPPLKFTDGPMGVRQEFEPDSWKAMGGSDDYVTYLPCNSALAATWNRELARELGSALGEETRGRGKDVILAPGVNIKRSPLCGRNFEYFSEDPYLTGELAAPLIQGIQQWDVSACVKHFALNNQETQRLNVEVEAEDEALYGIYLPAFSKAVREGGTYCLMGAYNRFRGEYGCQSKYLLKDVLRGQWEYDGLIVSDWGGVHDTVLAACSPLDVEMSVTSDFDQYFMAEPLKEKIQAGAIPESLLDEKVIHILMLMLRLHMLPGSGPRKRGTYAVASHRQTALEVARESVVLLKNGKGRLPLDRDSCRKVLVIGENGESLHAAGGGSAEIKALYEISPLMGIKRLLGGACQVDYARGYCRDHRAEDTGVSWQETSLEDGGGSVHAARADAALEAERKTLREEAVRLASSPEYDEVIFVGGLNHDHDCEGNDRADMKLPYGQDLLIRELLSVNPRTVVVLLGGSPVEMGAWIGQADSLVWCWYAGAEGGTALAEVLFGLVNPSGKLPESFYKTHTDCSAHCVGEFPGTDKVCYREGVFVGYRYLDTFQVEPQFCFGHGLSYTTFVYQEARLVRNQEQGGFQVVCRITNTGRREGKETVQVYFQQQKPDRESPLRELAGFGKITLKPGETEDLVIPLEGTPANRQIAVGSSSRDIWIVI